MIEIGNTRLFIILTHLIKRYLVLYFCYLSYFVSWLFYCFNLAEKPIIGSLIALWQLTPLSMTTFCAIEECFHKMLTCVLN